MEEISSNSTNHHHEFSLMVCFIVHCCDTNAPIADLTASAFGAVDSGFDYGSGQANDFKIGIYSFPA